MIHLRMIPAIVVAAAAGPVVAQSSVKTADYSFDYNYPAKAAAIAPLKAWLDADRAKLRAGTARDAAAYRREARKGGFPFRAYETQKTWKVVTDTPRFLSLSGESYAYTGGAHGSPGSTSLVWDKASRQRIDTKAVFTAPAAIQAAFGAPWCAWLARERVRRAGGQVVDDSVFKCPAVKELTLLLGSTNGQRIDRIGLIADPYVAGSFAEGPYEATLPMTAAVLRAVKPAYRTAFAVR